MVLELTLKAFSVHNWVIRAAEQGLDMGFSRRAVPGSAGSAQTFSLPINREDVQTKPLQNNTLVLWWLAGRGGEIKGKGVHL